MHIGKNNNHLLPTRKISFIGVMTALCVSTNYLMIGLVNVKLMDLFVFVSGCVMGIPVGVSIGVLTWLVYGTLNPLGFNIPTLVATCVGESFYGIAGGLFRRYLRNEPHPYSSMLGEKGFWETNIKFGMAGFFLTFAYDMFTNLVTSFVFDIPLIPYIVMGIPFTAIHEVSNFLFFFFGGNILVNAVTKITLKEVSINER